MSMKAPDGFVPLGSNSSHWKPTSTGEATLGSKEPQLVVLCSWMGAQPKHIAKYTTAYQKLLPQAEIVMIQSHILDMTYRSNYQQRQTLAPVTNIVSKNLDRATEEVKAPIVLHVFSHGGSNSAIQLLRATSETARTDKPLPLQAFILDSTPGDADYWRSFNAVETTLPKSGPTRLLGQLSIHFTLALTYAGVWLGLSQSIKHFRQVLRDARLFSLKTPRAYLYSKADRMVDWELVQKHADEAGATGYSVRQLCFESSSHCGHIMEDDVAYWDMVKSTWAA